MHLFQQQTEKLTEKEGWRTKNEREELSVIELIKQSNDKMSVIELIGLEMPKIEYELSVIELTKQRQDVCYRAHQAKQRQAVFYLAHQEKQRQAICHRAHWARDAKNIVHVDQEDILSRVQRSIKRASHSSMDKARDHEKKRCVWIGLSSFHFVSRLPHFAQFTCVDGIKLLEKEVLRMRENQGRIIQERVEVKAQQCRAGGLAFEATK
ncbi:hypothetical protein RND71_021173 [Anisodus tanguticus]|uniref:Uncharacterized protein n=1 Tax=Anisodus tanguticus TaxID=243964 RepID=A0AAE1VEX6_9SOLA|nr:hypothetical protein RND71_021173 [Anisodus tanguticus]